MSATNVLSHGRWDALCRSILVAAGTPPEVAVVVAEHLVDANLCGHDSHGVQLVPNYVRMIRDGAIVPAARARVAREGPATVLLDGGWGWGHAAAVDALEVALRLARAAGVGAVSLVRCNHVGRLGYYCERAAAAGAATLVTTGAVYPEVLPYGGRAPTISTNPMAFGFPTRETPFVLDFATTALARGKILAAQLGGRPVPPGTGVDADGRPTTDPRAILDGGAMLPFGGYKGYGLGIVAALFGDALTRGFAFDEGRLGSALLIVAIDAGAFGEAAEIARTADTMLRAAKASPPAEGFDEVRVPGERAARERERRRREGFGVPEATWAAIAECARSLGVPLEAAE